MQVTEQLAEGLKREIKIVVPADDMRGRLDEKLDDAKSKVRLKGFRPGKVPAAHLKNMYGRSMMAEIVDDIIKSSSRDIPAERGEKAAMAPQITMTEDEAEANEMLAGAKDFEFSLAYEILPSIEIKDFSKIEIVRPMVEIGDEEVMEQVEKVAENARPYESKDGAAKEKDRLTMDYSGKVDGEAFEGGTDTGAQIVLGSGSFIPGFEEQLSGAKKGEDKTVKVTFPADYPAAHLAGKDAVFEVSVKDVEKPGKLTFDDALAEKLGLESFDRLKTVVREQIESQFGQHTRQKVKRQILDALDEEYQFDTPEKLVEAEFDNIWRQVTHDLEHAGKTFADEDTTEEEAREEYRKLAERRVRLGLVLSEIGTQAEIKVGDEEMERAVYEQVRRYPGQEKEVFEFLKGNPEALAGIRAPLFEEKVIDHLMAGMKVKDKTVSKDELMADDEEDTAPVKKTAKSKAAGKASSSKGDKDGSDKKEAKSAKKPAAAK